LTVEALEDRCLLDSGLSAAIVADIVPGAAGSNPAYFLAVNGTLYFTAEDSAHGRELWKSDGTAAGTVLVKDINPGSGSSSPGNLTKIGSTLYFTANDGAGGYELWKSDGTAAGTVLVKDIRAGGQGSDPHALTNVNGTLFFGAFDKKGGGLWKSDGTPNGTVLVKRINSKLEHLTASNSLLFFSAYDKMKGRELWRSDGTPKGTFLVKDIHPGEHNDCDGGGAFGQGCLDKMVPNNSNPAYLTDLNGTLYFTAYDGVRQGLWKSDGTAAGTVLVKDVQVGSLMNRDGTLFLSVNDGIHGHELWQSDGTAAGTVLVRDIAPGAAGSNPSALTNVNGRLYFTANDGVNGSELWTSDGTAAGTVLVKDIYSGPNSSHVYGLTNVNGLLYFGAEDGVHGFELWQSEGTNAGTVLVEDIRPGSADSFPQYLVAMNNRLYFSADDGIHGRELWDPPPVAVPNDPLFHQLWNLQIMGAEQAWGLTTGSTQIVAAEIDHGVDYMHPDLYKNIWINQAEIPRAIRSVLQDTDGDGLFTFWDLNEPVNQGPGKITDLNGTGYIDGGDLLRPLAQGGWADGRGPGRQRLHRRPDRLGLRQRR
jgi:ELWxxDGT repeat protein